MVKENINTQNRTKNESTGSEFKNDPKYLFHVSIELAPVIF